MLLFSIMLLGTPQVAAASKLSREDRQPRSDVPRREESHPLPNFIILLTDDVDVDLLTQPLLDYFPNLKSLHDQSVRFSNAFVTTPLCGPSRAAILRGQYGHRTGILTNTPASNGLLHEPSGGFPIFYDRGYVYDNLAPRMNVAGYRTLLVGKYLHENFFDPAGYGYVPPGWDEFNTSWGAKYFETYRYINGVGSFLEPGIYRTDAERDSAVTLLQATQSEPWFLLLAPFGVHSTRDSQGMIAARHAGLFQNETIQPSPDWQAPDEWNLYHEIDQAGVDSLNALYRDRLRAMLAIDEMVGAIINEVASRGELAETYIIVTSDNGMLLGHRRHKGKDMPYDRALRIPLWVSGPGILPGQTDRLASLADLAPTVLDYATGFVPGYMDGMSLRPVIENPLLDPAMWRQTILSEGATWLAGGPGLSNVHNSQWTAAITETEKYVEFNDGRWMYHRLDIDPYELVSSSTSLVDRTDWQARLGLIEQCAGRGCRSQKPETAISTPQASIRPATGGFSIDGFAGATPGAEVTEVRLIVQDTSNQLYWNGLDWQSSWIQVNADLANPFAEFSAWSYFFAVNAQEVSRVVVRARSYDSSGLWDRRLPVVLLTLRDSYADRPDTTVMLPNFVRTGEVTIAGWVVDRNGVDRVELTVNGTVVPTQLGPTPRGELIRTWTARIELQSGMNEIVAFGVDTTGLVDDTPAVQTVFVN